MEGTDSLNVFYRILTEENILREIHIVVPYFKLVSI